MPHAEFRRDTFVGALINIVAFRMRRELEQRLREHGVDLSMWPVLACLWEQDGVAQAHFGEVLGVPGYATSRGVDRLEAAGLVTRRNDPDNRRIRRVFLTDAGRDMEATLVPLAREINCRTMARLDADEQADLLALLRKLVGQAA